MNGVLAVLLYSSESQRWHQKGFDQEYDKRSGVFLITLSQKRLESFISNVTGQETGFRITFGF